MQLQNRLLHVVRGMKHDRKLSEALSVKKTVCACGWRTGLAMRAVDWLKADSSSVCNDGGTGGAIAMAREGTL